MNPQLEEGQAHLAWIFRFQVALLGLGTLAWWVRSGTAALVFLAAGVISLGFWQLHRFLVGRMLTPSVRRRWLYGFLMMGKLALIILGARFTLGRFPDETLPFSTGILLFVGGILLEAGRLVFQPGTNGE